MKTMQVICPGPACMRYTEPALAPHSTCGRVTASNMGGRGRWPQREWGSQAAEGRQRLHESCVHLQHAQHIQQLSCLSGLSRRPLHPPTPLLPLTSDAVPDSSSPLAGRPCARSFTRAAISPNKPHAPASMPAHGQSISKLRLRSKQAKRRANGHASARSGLPAETKPLLQLSQSLLALASPAPAPTCLPLPTTPPAWLRVA